MADYSETVTKLRDVYRAYVVTGNKKAGQFLSDAADAIERLQYQLEKYHERVVYLEEMCKELPEWKVTIH